MKFGKRGTGRMIFSSPITLVVVIVVFIFLVKVVWNMRERLISSKLRLETAQSELAKLEDHRIALANKIQYLSTEQGIEAELRTKYRAVREGESVAVIVDNDQVATVVQNGSGIGSEMGTTKQSKKSWFGKFMEFIGF
jgi:cell division protein FtsB